MFNTVRVLLRTLISLLVTRSQLATENLLLRQQVAVLLRRQPRPRLTPMDRGFWVVASKVFSRWKKALVLVKPETVIAWHRKGFRLFWTWKSRNRTGFR